MVDKKNKALDTILGEAIESSGVTEVLRTKMEESTIKVIHRVTDKRIWMAILQIILPQANGWTAHVCQQYFMRDKKLVYGWNFILQSVGNMQGAVTHVVSLLRKSILIVPRTILGSGPLDSFPLIGASPGRSSTNTIFDPRLPGPSQGGSSHKGAFIRGE